MYIYLFTNCFVFVLFCFVCHTLTLSTSMLRRTSISGSVVAVIKHNRQWLAQETKTEPENHIPDLASLEQLSCEDDEGDL
jgi:hypothetical protein